MKKIIVLALMFAGLKSFSQSVAINTTGSAANASAMLDVASTNKGFLAPRMTTTQRTSIVSPADGLLVYDTDTKTFWYFSTTWKEMINSSGGGGGTFSLPYNGTGADPVQLFSITNTSGDVTGASIYGKRGAGSGSVLGISSGVWGDNASGAGVAGSSNSGYGLMGFSATNHAIYGSASAPGFAGVYGLGNSMYTYGVMGDAENIHTIAVYGKSGTLGKSGFFETADSSNADTTVLLKTVGTGPAFNLQHNNPFTSNDAFSATTKGFGSAIFAQSAMGTAAHFKKTNNSNGNEVVTVENTANVGAGMIVNMTNGSGTGEGLLINHLGQGHGIRVSLSSPANDQDILDGYSGGTGGGIRVTLGNSIAAGDGLNISNAGTGYGVIVGAQKGPAGRFYGYATNNSTLMSVQNEGTGQSFSIFQANAANANDAFKSFTSGNGAAVSGFTNGTGSGVLATSLGTGPALLVNNSNANAVNSLATFQKNGINKARIDGTGKGFFNGGTQSSGADLAEAFDVQGSINDYEMGDVLVISTDADRTVEKSSGAYSTLVAGVYATKPGVLLTEETIETDISGKVPMGVVGVIPTKVCLEGGEIKRGDLLVTSSTPGVAMKADINKLKPGQVVGKALENFSSQGVGKIKVLVNVK